jgi:hypothetical protein
VQEAFEALASMSLLALKAGKKWTVKTVKWTVVPLLVATVCDISNAEPFFSLALHVRHFP